jgi:hypothetical protein
VVEGGVWCESTAVVAPTLVVCDAGSALLYETCAGPLLPVVALTPREIQEFLTLRQPFGVVYHFSTSTAPPPLAASMTVLSDTLSPFRVLDQVTEKLPSSAPSGYDLVQEFSVGQVQLSCPTNSLVTRLDDVSRWPPTTAWKLRIWGRRQGWTHPWVPLKQSGITHYLRTFWDHANPTQYVGMVVLGLGSMAYVWLKSR